MVQWPILEHDPLVPLRGPGRAQDEEDSVVSESRVPAQVFHQYKDLNLSIVAPSPHLRPTEKRRVCLRVADFPNNRRDNTILVGARPDRTIWLTRAGGAGFGEFLKRYGVSVSSGGGMVWVDTYIRDRYKATQYVSRYPSWHRSCGYRCVLP